MSLTKGNVTISGSGVVSGAGFARQVYDLLEAATDFQGVAGSTLATAKRQLAAIANAAAVTIDQITQHATVSTTDTHTPPIAWSGTGTHVAPGAVT